MIMLVTAGVIREPQTQPPMRTVKYEHTSLPSGTHKTPRISHVSCSLKTLKRAFYKGLQRGPIWGLLRGKLGVYTLHLKSILGVRL